MKTMKNNEGRARIAAVLAALAWGLTAGMARAATCTWQNNGSWDTTPSSPADVIGVAAGSSNLAWNATMPATVASWTQAAGYTGTVTFQTVYGTNGFTNFTVSGDVTLSGGAWTHRANTGGETNRLRLTVGGNLLVSNAAISADAVGYAIGYGSGYAAYCGGAYGGTATADNNGHGGGAVLNANTYGSVIAPTNLGSSGASYAGGGALLLTVAGTTTVAAAGSISACGGAGNSGGAGGSIYLRTGWLIGSGTLQANGGNTSWDKGAGGGGGRVSIVLTGAGADFSLWNGTNAACGGVAIGGGSGSSAAAGTVYRKTTTGVDSLIIDNNNTAVINQVSTLMPPAPNAVNLNGFSNVTIRKRGILGVRGDTTLDLNTFVPMLYGAANSAIAIDRFDRIRGERGQLENLRSHYCPNEYGQRRQFCRRRRSVADRGGYHHGRGRGFDLRQRLSGQLRGFGRERLPPNGLVDRCRNNPGCRG